MSCTTPILNIELGDCLGDSIGKHNYNALVLDAQVCNLSSLYFNSSSDLSDTFSNFLSVLNIFETLIPVFNQKQTNDIITTSVVTEILSSYWSNQEFTVQYPINAATIFDNTVLDVISTNEIIELINKPQVIPPSTITFTDNTLFTVPDGVELIYALAVGGGGSGGVSSGTADNNEGIFGGGGGGGGGGSGGVSSGYIQVTPGDTLTINVGKGSKSNAETSDLQYGSGNTNNTYSGNGSDLNVAPGGNSSVLNPTGDPIILAKGGNSGGIGKINVGGLGGIAGKNGNNGKAGIPTQQTYDDSVGGAGGESPYGGYGAGGNGGTASYTPANALPPTAGGNGCVILSFTPVVTAYSDNINISFTPVSSIPVETITSSYEQIIINDLNSINIDKIMPRIKASCLSYLYRNYPISNGYLDGTIANVVMQIFNLTPNPDNPKHLIQEKIVPSNFTYSQREMKAEYTRGSIYVLTNLITRFVVNNGQWHYIGTNNPTYNGLYI